MMLKITSDREVYASAEQIAALEREMSALAARIFKNPPPIVIDIPVLVGDERNKKWIHAIAFRNIGIVEKEVGAG